VSFEEAHRRARAHPPSRGLPRPGRVRVAFAAPIMVHEMSATPEVAGRLVEQVLWPEVEEEFRRLRAAA